MNTTELVLLIAFSIALAFILSSVIYPDSHTNTNLAYENGVKCAVKYNLNEQQEEIGIYWKEYNISETCKKLMEKHSIGGI